MLSGHATSFRGALCALVIALSAFAACAQAQTYNLRVIHRFSGAPHDGSQPRTGVQFDSAGNLYGTTALGGASHAGAIFKIAKDGTETVVHSFDDPNGDIDPGVVTIDPATGDVYGTTAEGGENEYGKIYKLAANGSFTVLHDFDATQDDTHPSASLFRDDQGNLYGTTTGGVGYSWGTVFEYGADGSYRVLHVFTGPDGTDPLNGVIRDKAGNLYGFTEEGGANNGGTIFKLAPDGTLTTLHTFPGFANATPPGGGPLIRDNAGNLYGTTYGIQGYPPIYGTVFKLAPDGTFTTLYTFTGGIDGLYANALLRIGGNFYGTTEDGGDDGFGAVFKLTPDGTFTVLHSFTLLDGIFPQSGLTLNRGRLFGTTSASGPRVGFGGGTVFSLGMGKR